MDKTGMIEITTHYDLRGNPETYSYRWTGGPVGLMSRNVSEIYAKPGDSEFWVGPFRVKILEQDSYQNLLTVVRQDYFLWRLVYLWHRYGILFDFAYRRFILTLAVWRLADYNPATVPTWRDIKLFRRK